jgi:hypothetical protein
MKHLLEEIQPQLPVVLQIKLWPTGHLPFFRTKVEKACHRIEARLSQASLKADIAEKCRLVNDKKAALDAKTDTSASSQRVDSLGQFQFLVHEPRNLGIDRPIHRMRISSGSSPK